MVQFISKSQLATYRAVVETVKYIARAALPNGGITFSNIFYGVPR